MPELYLEEVRRGARRNVLPTMKDGFKLRIAKLGDYSTALGAAALIRQQQQALEAPQANSKLSSVSE